VGSVSASMEQWAPQCKIVYDKFHILQHANDAIDQVRKAEFFRQESESAD
jgi:transposase